MAGKTGLTTEKTGCLPEITVITICKNSSPTIAKTIDSVASQKASSIEYIIIDGDSDDGTQDIVRSFGSKIDIFISEPDNGIADAFNKGISLANGEVIALLNSDDILLPDSLQKVQETFVKNPGAQVVHGDILIYQKDTFVKRVKPAGRWWYPWRLVLFNHPATFVRKEVYERHGLFSHD